MPEYLTFEQLKNLKKELNYLKTVKTREIAEHIRYAASFGDLSENAAYTEAKERQGFLQGKILELEEKLRDAKIIEKKQNDKVQVGSVVTVSLDGEENKINIVSPSLADSINGKVSYESPLGKAVLNKSVGGVAKIKTEDGEVINYKIIKVE